MCDSRNFQKYHTKNIAKRILINKFLSTIENISNSLQGVSKVLDIGCGEAMVMRRLHKIRNDWQIDGLDISPESLQVAKSILPDNNFFQASATDTKLKDKEYDLIISLEVLEHIESPQKALVEYSRLTKKYCLISVPLEPFFTWGNLLTGSNIKLWGKDPEHVNFWGKRGITKLVTQYFDIIEVRISFPWTIILAIKK